MGHPICFVLTDMFWLFFVNSYQTCDYSLLSIYPDIVMNNSLHSDDSIPSWTHVLRVHQVLLPIC